MRILTVVAAFVLMAAPASAAPGRALLSAAHALTAPTAACPAGTPAQPITVVNQAHASRLALARVEAAITDQSLQLRTAWGTPCVTFRPGGWPLYLRIGGTVHGVHYDTPTRMQVYTGGYNANAWSQALSHEVVEALVDRDIDYVRDNVGYQLEVADPVDERGYKLDGVYVTDFTLPAYYAGALLDDPAAAANVTCPPQGGQCVFSGPLLANADASGPYDQLGILTRPWDTTWQRAA